MRPNVLFIALDTIRADHLSCYGYPKLTTPNIDGLAERGMLFRRFFSVGNCTHPGFTAMFTGLFPESSGVVSHWTRVGLADDVPTLAECFAQAGYQTAAIDNLYDGWLPLGYRLYPWFRRGYHHYGYPEHGNWYKPAHLVTQKAVQWLDTAPKQPFFCFVHYWQPNAPYNKAPEQFYRFYDGDDPCDPRLDFMPPHSKEKMQKIFGLPVTDPAYAIAAYDAEVAYADHAVGDLLDALAQRGLREDTAVVVTGDHGEIMWPPRLAVGRLWCFSHIALHDDCLQLPLIICGPDIQVAQVEEDAQLVDILPTLAQWCDLPMPSQTDGRSLVPAFSGEPIGGREAIFVSENTYQKHRAVRRSPWKFMRMEEDLASMPARLLYDLEADPLETENLADQRPDVADEMNALIEQYLRQTTGRERDPLHVQDLTGRAWEPSKTPDHLKARGS